MKYSHAKNCTAKFSARPKEASALPAVEEAEADEEEDEEEEPETEEEEEEVKPPPITPAGPAPILKRTVSVALPKVRDPSQPTGQKVSKQFPPVKKTVTKVKQPQTDTLEGNKDQPQQPTPTNIYGRENRNERAKQKTEKMCNLFVNAF